MANKNYYIGHIVDGFNDGGQSRNNAFRLAFENEKAKMLPVYDSNHFIRLFYFINILRFMLFSKRNQIFIHQGTLMVLFPAVLLRLSWVNKLVFGLIKHTTIANKVTIEVNDLPYEQAKDLELPVRQIDKVFQDNLYSLKNANYIFASHEMGKYINEKFNINYKVIINGSDEIKNNSNPGINIPECFDLIEPKFIYAGGLNKGRQIELLISIFREKKAVLILIGEWGEWLLDYKLPNNVFYLGKYKEDHAHYLTSLCDIGIIPYDDKRFYYNICYPTKASFYITAGIPFLSTQLIELKNIFEKSEMAYFIPIENWGEFIQNFDKSSLAKAKKIVEVEKHNFYWKELLNTNLNRL